MTVKTVISPGFLWRLLLVAVACLGMTLWCIYDAQVTYPNQMIRAAAYNQLREATREEFAKTTDLERDPTWKNELAKRWRDLAHQRSWPGEVPGKPHDENDILVQYGMAGVVAPIGFIFLFRYLRARKRWIEADKKGLKGSWGQSVAFDEIQVIDKKKWNNKGIAYLRYEQDGRKRTFILDDFKFEARSTEKILRIVEKRVGFDKITNGQPLPPEKN
ncbi:MAG: hypothetical protein KDA42_07275 [Planctomycetales bacterium]|nr:hypothetical protein [Planctomycetales bacterium]